MVVELARLLAQEGDKPVAAAGSTPQGTAAERAATEGAAVQGTATEGTATEGTAAPAWGAVEAAFLDVVQPDIAAGYAALVRAGCTEIVAHPFFLFAGNHTARDIPAALAEARREHPSTRWTITSPLGLHPGVVGAARARIAAALEHPEDGYPAVPGRSLTTSATTAASG